MHRFIAVLITAASTTNAGDHASVSDIKKRLIAEGYTTRLSSRRG